MKKKKNKKSGFSKIIEKKDVEEQEYNDKLSFNDFTGEEQPLELADEEGNIPDETNDDFNKPNNE
jgi:hypothetical protein